MKYQNGEEFLNSLYQNMHMSDVVMHTAEKSDQPVEKIEKYMQRLEKVHQIASTSKHKLDMLKQFYYQKYIIQELPESYIKLQQKIFKEEGHGEIAISDDQKKELLETIQKDQKSSLNEWIDYLTSDDADYPMWFKHYVFSGMLNLGKYDKEKRKFQRRTKDTVEKYLGLNQEILAYIYTTLSHEIGQHQLTENDILALEHGESFQKMYLFYANKMGIYEYDEETEGKWIKYEQGENYHKLWESLQGKNTGWCTAGEATCKTQLAGGDFYVYYTKDEEGEYTKPRIAIRMNRKDEIGEVRGIGKQQNLESNMTGIAEEKLSEFPDKQSYEKKVHDMKKLTEIDHKEEEGIELTKEELIFLYEINGPIEGFGYQKDPRIEEIQRKRNTKKDLAYLYDCQEEQIATTIEDFNQNDIVVYYDDLEWGGETVPKTFHHLKAIIGSARFKNLKDATGLSSLQTIGRDARFDNLKNARGLNSLQTIGRDAKFDNLKDARGLNSLQTIGEDAWFKNLEDATGLNSLQTIGRDAKFDNLKDARGLNSLQTIGRDACFINLKNARGLSSLQTIGRDAWFKNLEDATGLNSLQTIGEDAWFKNLEDATGLNSLQTIGRDVCFINLKNARGLSSLQTIGRDVRFDNLKNARDLSSLQSIGGTVNVNYSEQKKELEQMMEDSHRNKQDKQERENRK